MAQSRASLAVRVEGTVALLAFPAKSVDDTAACVRAGSLCVAVIACLCALTGGSLPAGYYVRRRAM